MKNLSQDNRSSGRDLNQRTLEYEAGVLITRQQRSLGSCVNSEILAWDFYKFKYLFFAAEIKIILQLEILINGMMQIKPDSLHILNLLLHRTSPVFLTSLTEACILQNEHVLFPCQITLHTTYNGDRSKHNYKWLLKQRLLKI